MDTVVQPISVCDLSRQTEVDLSEENWIVWVADIQQLSGLILCSTTIGRKMDCMGRRYTAIEWVNPLLNYHRKKTGLYGSPIYSN